MKEITVVIRDMDWDTLEAFAEREWRRPEQQASAIVERALQAERARSNTDGKPRSRGGRRAPAANGVAAPAHS